MLTYRKNKNSIYLLLILFLSFFSQRVLASFHFQASKGQLWYELKHDDGTKFGIKAKQSHFSVTASALDYLPVSAGLSYDLLTLNNSEFTQELESVNIEQFSGEVILWTPGDQIITPYLKIHHVFQADIKVLRIAEDDFDRRASMSTDGIVIGLKIVMVPISSLLFEFGRNHGALINFVGHNSQYHSFFVNVGFEVII